MKETKIIRHITYMLHQILEQSNQEG